MKDLGIFQIILLAVFSIGLIVGVLIFAGVIPGFKKTVAVEDISIEVWGTPSMSTMASFIQDFNKEHKDTVNVRYIAKNPETFEIDLTEALARGQGPDAIIYPDSLLEPLSDFIQILPYTSFPVGDFRTTFIDGADIYLEPNGISAIPVSVDPLILYYNKNIYTKANIFQPPSGWSAFLKDHQVLNHVSNSGVISQSGVAMGSFTNIANAKEIVLTLMMQVGVPLIERGPDDRYHFKLNIPGSNIPSEAAAAFEFFTRFATPGRVEYSWNVSLPDAELAFANGFSANYFGFASERSRLSKLNPNLPFEVAKIPQSENGPKPITFGRLHGVSVLKSSANKQTSFAFALALVGREQSIKIAEAMQGVSPRKDLLARVVDSPFYDIANRSALIAQSWRDPNREASNLILQNAVTAVTTGVVPITSVMGQIFTQINNLF